MTLPAAGPRWLYLHGFASSPESAKGVALAAHYQQQGVTLQRLDLRLPSFERLRLSAGIAATRAAIGDEPAARAVVMGSSLGGLTAALTAVEDARVCALVLLAPAFDLTARWRRRIGEAAWREWEASGWLEVRDWASGATAKLSFEFARDAAAVEARLGAWPDVRVPTLLVHGRRDETVGIDGSRRWAAGKRHVRLVEVDDDHELTTSLPIIATEADAHLAGLLRKRDEG